MKKVLSIVLFLMTAIPALRAQDTLAVAAVDSVLVGKDILGIIGPGVSIDQTPVVRSALRTYIASNKGKELSGYRIRVFYDNGQNARTKSESIERYIAGTYAGIRVYRTYESPNYKVSVGDFRTKDEALGLYNSLKAIYPTAFIIKENINCPR